MDAVFFKHLLRIVCWFSFFLLLNPLSLKSQEKTYLTDLASLYKEIQKTPSYKVQIKGQKQRQYELLYEELIRDSLHVSDDFSYFYNLSKLIFPLRDNHIGFYQVPNPDHFKDQEAVRKYIASEDFKHFPAYNLNTDSLKIVLTKSPIDSVEGIYFYDKYYTVGVFRISQNEYAGIILDSEIDLWQKGQIAFQLFATGDKMYKAVYAHPITKNFLLYTNEKYQDQVLINSNALFYNSFSNKPYSKIQSETDFIDLSKDIPVFLYQTIQPDIQYIRIGSFQNFKTRKQQSDSFLISIQNILSAANLIVDLRNNEGGAESEMRKYLKQLENYNKPGKKIYVLVNNGTLSQAELFMLKLKKMDNVVTIGQTTRGMLTYGNNTGKRILLPGKKYEFYPTDMNDNGNVLMYEDYGIKPDVILSAKSDWMQQIVKIINGR